MGARRAPDPSPPIVVPRTNLKRWAAALAAALAMSAPPAAAQRAELSRVIQRRVMSNGLEVIVIENHGVPLVTLEFDVRNGAFTQTPEYAGLAHMYEHMFFRANRQHPDADEFLYRASQLGAVFNGTTREENVSYYATLHRDSVGAGLRLLAGALREPLFRAEELEREREVVIGEYDRNESSPFFQLTREMDRRLYPGQLSRKNTIGDRQVILTTTPEKMRVIQKKYYVPNNTALLIAGDVVPDSAFALAQRVLGDWPRGPDPFATDPIPDIPPLAKTEAVIVEQPISAAVILMQWQGPSVGKDPEATYVADVFSDVLNQPHSALQRKLVDGGLFQGVTVNYYTLNHTGPITISGETSPERLREAVAAMRAEVEKLADPGYYTAAELEPVKQQRIVGTKFGLERASGFAHQLGFWWAVAGVDYYLGYTDNMARQTVTDLRAYARKYIIGKPRVVGVLLHPDARRALQLTEKDLLGEAR
jgi:zinc protease